MSALPPAERTALILRYWLDLPVDQVAEIMQRPPNTVKTLTRRGVLRLKETFSIEEATECR